MQVLQDYVLSKVTRNSMEKFPQYNRGFLLRRVLRRSQYLQLFRYGYQVGCGGLFVVFFSGGEAFGWCLVGFFFFKKNTFSGVLSVCTIWFKWPVFSKFVVEQWQKNKWAKIIRDKAVKHITLQTSPLSFIQ